MTAQEKVEREREGKKKRKGEKFERSLERNILLNLAVEYHLEYLPSHDPHRLLSSFYSRGITFFFPLGAVRSRVLKAFVFMHCEQVAEMFYIPGVYKRWFRISGAH